MPPVDPRKPLHDAHALAIGRLVVAWNGYQENLGELYATLFSRRDWALAMASWHALENDRAQRAMLLATATAKLKPDSRALKEIQWLVKTTNAVISDNRNTGIHMPLMSLTELDGTHHILPDTIHGHARARKMLGKDLLKEYAHYADQIRKMNWHATIVKSNLTPKGIRHNRVTRKL
jgi:hypothetical protein